MFAVPYGLPHPPPLLPGATDDDAARHAKAMADFEDANRRELASIATQATLLVLFSVGLVVWVIQMQFGWSGVAIAAGASIALAAVCVGLYKIFLRLFA